MIRVLPAADRTETVQQGITTWHCFSSGAHCDPDNTHFGPLVTVDEHLVAPGAGFARHAHRGVEIVSWVLDGALRHEDESGRVTRVVAGTAQLQVAGTGIEHSETNASDVEPLRFVQMALLAGVGEPGYLLQEPPLVGSAGTFAVHGRGPLEIAAPLLHLFVTSGAYEIEGRALRTGDSVRADEPLGIRGDGQLLVWELDAV